MSLNAARFVRNRPTKLAVTNQRINQIVWYLIECYLLLRKDNLTYSKAQIKASTSHKLEDYFKMELVDSYLMPNKKRLQQKVSALEQINFGYELVKRFKDVDQIEKSDKIDIYINKIGLRDVWKEQDENIYFAVECKRIKILSDAKSYVEDIEKFVNRKHNQLRLPFEGMIAFIENKKLTHKTVTDEINERLKKFPSIVTIEFLASKMFHKGFNNSYASTHKKSFSNDIFSIFHLMFDYSSIVTS